MKTRSCLFSPAHNRHLIDRALESEADLLILDLEDAVPLPDKAHARRNLQEYAQDGKFAGKQVFIRIDKPVDIEEVCLPGVTGVMLPKVKSGTEVTQANWMLRDQEIKHRVSQFQMILLVETPAAVISLQELLHCSSRIVALALGAEDLRTGLHGCSIEYARNVVLYTGRAFGLDVIDTPVQDVRDEQVNGYFQDHLSYLEGFDGRLLTHTRQIATANEQYQPFEEEYQKAKQIVLRYKVEGTSTGVIYIDGRVIGPPHIKRYLQVMEDYEKTK